MNVENVGTVLQPDYYKSFIADMAGDTDDTGGIYVLLYSQDGAKRCLFWDASLKGVLQQLRDEGILIAWEKPVNELSRDTQL